MDQQANRRREERLPVTRECLLDVKSPTWAMLPKPLPALTENLTRHGLRIAVPGMSIERFDRWRRHVETGEELIVAVSMDLGGEPLCLSGSIVWTELVESGDPLRGDCALGILLSLMAPEAEEALARALAKIGSGF